MSFLSDELLARIHDRAAQVDRENRFPTEDLADLRGAGYLQAFVPASFGGAGLTLEQIAAEQTRLAKASPGTALGINMHQIIVGLGRHLVGSGNPRGELILRGAIDGEIFGFGISEPGNDLVLFGSITQARTDGRGGYRLHGTKVFTSLAPVWTQLLTFGQDNTDPAAPMDVFGLIKRDDGGFTIKNDWDTVGMRATQSNTTVLEGAPMPEAQVLARVAPGPSTEPVIFGIFANFEVLLAATYQGIGERAIEVAANQVRTRHSVKNNDVYANDPDIRWRLAEAALAMNGSAAMIRDVTRDLDAGVDRGPIWLPQLSAAKNAATEAALRATEQAIRSGGGSSYSNNNELSRLYRDVLGGLFQPTDQESLHSAWANVVLGPADPRA